MQFKAEHSIWHSCQLITLKRGNSSNSFDFKEVYSLYRFTIIIERTNISDKILSQYLYYFNPFLRSNSSISFKLIDSRSALS